MRPVVEEKTAHLQACAFKEGELSTKKRVRADEENRGKTSVC